MVKYYIYHAGDVQSGNSRTNDRYISFNHLLFTKPGKSPLHGRWAKIRFEDWEFAYALVLGSAEAIRYCRSIGEDRISAQIARHSDFLRSGLAEIDRVKVLDRGPRLAGLVTFHVEGSDAKYIVDELLHRGINVVGSFRNFAVFDFDEKGVQWAVRASPHYYNTQEELEHFLEAVKEIAALPKR